MFMIIWVMACQVDFPEGCYDCIEAVIHYTKTELYFADKNIVLIGQSVGTGVVIDYISKYKWKHVVMLISHESIISVVSYSSMGCSFDKLTIYTKLEKSFVLLQLYMETKMK